MTRVKCVTPYVSSNDSCQLSTLVCLLREISPSALMLDNLSALTFALGSSHGSDTCASYVNDTCELSSGSAAVCVTVRCMCRRLTHVSCRVQVLVSMD